MKQRHGTRHYRPGAGPMPGIGLLRAILLGATLAIPAVPHASQAVFNLGPEPKTLDPHKAEGMPEAHVILNLIEGLTRTDSKALPIPGMAERWESNDDSTSFTFHLREANWSDGTPVTAEHFRDGWIRCLSPETAANYAHQLFFIEGAEEFHSGKQSDLATVGITIVTSKTLNVRLKGPTPFFPGVVAHPAYAPFRNDWTKAHPKWALTPAEYIVNGPFRLEEWRHNDRLILKKNPRYYAANEVKLDTLVMMLIANESTALMQWEAGAVDMTESLPIPDIPRLKKEGKYHSVPYLGVYYVAFNCSRKPFDDARVRKALSLAVDRDIITNAILRAGQPAAYGVVSPGITIGGKDFREEAGDLFKGNAEEARRLLAEAGYPRGRGFPTVKYLFNDREDHRIIGQALQNMWLTELGIRVELETKEWKVFLQERRNGNYDMARAGWIGDYLDPVTFLDLFTSKSGNNDVFYKSDAFDALIAKAGTVGDQSARLNILRDAEKVLVADDMAVAPLYFYIQHYTVNPKLRGYVRNPLGYIYFRNAEMAP